MIRLHRLPAHRDQALCMRNTHQLHYVRNFQQLILFQLKL